LVLLLECRDRPEEDEVVRDNGFDVVCGERLHLVEDLIRGNGLVVTSSEFLE